MKESCGIFGIYAPGEDVARLTYFGLFALQHRGQEAAGIAVANGERIFLHKGLGLLNNVFTEEILQSLEGYCAIGHTRYSTTGSNIILNAQPIFISNKGEKLALAHNGNITNSLSLAAYISDQGLTLDSTSDSELIGLLIAIQEGSTIEEKIGKAMRSLRGAYSLTILTPRKVIAVRDPYGIRPLCIGRLNGNRWVFASESCALSLVEAEFVRDVEAGEIVVASEEGLKSYKPVPSPRKAVCIFEFIYFARPDSYIEGVNIHKARRRMGHALFQEGPVDADVVIGVPDTGTAAAIGYSEASGIPYGEGLLKNKYIGRTFILPDQRIRDVGIKLKLTPLVETIKGKRIVLVDDSIVRGTTTGKIVRMLFDAGAKEIHVRISSPPISYPCFFGIDTAVRSELIASRLSVEEIRDFIGATSLKYLSLEGLINAIGLPKENFCTACLTGIYPEEIPAHFHKLLLEQR